MLNEKAKRKQLSRGRKMTLRGDLSSNTQQAKIMLP